MGMTEDVVAAVVPRSRPPTVQQVALKHRGGSAADDGVNRFVSEMSFGVQVCHNDVKPAILEEE